MSRKNLIHKFIAFLLVFTLAYVQTVLINHQSHHNTLHSHKSSNTQVDSFIVKCIVCDYVFNKRSEPALLGSISVLTIFSKTIISFSTEELIHPSCAFHNEHTNKGPPTV